MFSQQDIDVPFLPISCELVDAIHISTALVNQACIRLEPTCPVRSSHHLVNCKLAQVMLAQYDNETAFTHSLVNKRRHVCDVALVLYAR